MSVEVQRIILLKFELKEALTKLYSQDMTKSHRHSILKVIKKYEEEVKDMRSVLKDLQGTVVLSELPEDDQKYLSETVEFPSIPKDLFENEKLMLAPRDEMFLELLTEK